MDIIPPFALGVMLGGMSAMTLVVVFYYMPKFFYWLGERLGDLISRRY